MFIFRTIQFLPSVDVASEPHDPHFRTPAGFVREAIARREGPLHEPRFGDFDRLFADGPTSEVLLNAIREQQCMGNPEDTLIALIDERRAREKGLTKGHLTLLANL